jgi:hypothetical protein
MPESDEAVTGNRPAHKVRIGSITASVFANASDNGKFSVKLQKSHKGADEHWHNIDKFNAGEPHRCDSGWYGSVGGQRWKRLDT